jgi:hypothetical protein
MKNRFAHLVVAAVLGLAVVVVLGSGRALAQDGAAATEGAPPAAPTPPAPAAASVSAPVSATEVTLRQGTISVDGDVVMGLSKGNAFKPIQIVPNLYYGVSDELTAGFAHNTNAEIFQAVSTPGGRGLCLSGSSDGCAHVYNSFSLDALFSFLRRNTVDLAAHGGVDFVLDPFLLSLRLGVKGKVGLGPMVLVFDPSANIGLIKRYENKEYLQVPVRIGFVVMSRLNVGVSAALNGQLDGFGDNYVVPVGAGATFAVNGAVDLRAQFAFDNLAGKNSSADRRTLSVGAAFHM